VGWAIVVYCRVPGVLVVRSKGEMRIRCGKAVLGVSRFLFVGVVLWRGKARQVGGGRELEKLRLRT